MKKAAMTSMQRVLTTFDPREIYLRTGFEIAKRTIARIKGPTATHLASGRVLPMNLAGALGR